MIHTILYEGIKVFLYFVIGYFIKKYKVLNEQIISVLRNLIINVTIPLILFTSFYKINFLKEGPSLLVMIAGVFIYYGLTFVIGWVIERRNLLSKAAIPVVRYCTMFGNVVFWGYPICYALFGDEGIVHATLFVVIQNILKWSVGVSFFKHNREKHSLEINLSIMAMAIGLVANITQIQIPVFALRTIDKLGDITIPMGLIITGTSLYASTNRKWLRDSALWIIVVIKCIAVPFVFMLFISQIDVSITVRGVLLIQVFAPVHASSPLFIAYQKGDEQLASKAVLVSTFISMIMIIILTKFL
ncbi:AEC family transporter [Cellulosilyticum sp. I15G10I2]|uniref:AEC family transporter n=1 Tax=Cellulosilyticum sp. I15G10I2 TaxID=1892843 RepID=UPI00085BF5F6|nr:AEC family transporter [Cellulosilyticum sp. I15G10I2]